MSEKQAKLIKIISVIGGLLGALICAALGFTLIKTNLLTAVLFFLLAGVCLLLIYPLYQVGNLAHLAFEHENKLRAVANQQARLMNGENDVLCLNAYRQSINMVFKNILIQFLLLSKHSPKKFLLFPQHPAFLYLLTS